MNRLSLAIALASLLVAGPAAADHHKAKPAGDIVAVAQGAGSFTTLVKALQAADLVKTLQGAGPFTVFAPTDEAFAKIPAADLEALLANKEKLRARCSRTTWWRAS
jgi:uncharacterized surface protein with fasciclin (FAS1) repeats